MPLAENIKRLRVTKGLTQAQVAEQAGLSRIAFRDIETGKTQSPRVGNLQSIAEALGARLQDLLAEPPRLETVRFRSKKLRTSKARERRKEIVVNVARWLQDFNGLEKILACEKPYALSDVAKKAASWRFSDRGKKAAVAAREALGLEEDEPIRDICGLLESAGVKIRIVDSALESFFGLSVGPEDGGPAIVVNVREDITVERRIFTAAHELGHLLLHPGAYDVEEVEEDEAEEKEAHLFGSHFLVPQEGFDKEWEESAGLHPVDRVLHVKRIFRASYMTILYRLIEMGIANEHIWPWFNAEYRRIYGESFGRKEEPLPLAPADFVEDRLSRMVRRALEKEKISLSRAAEILGEDLYAMRERAAAWKHVK